MADPRKSNGIHKRQHNQLPPKENPVTHGWVPVQSHPEGEMIYEQAGRKLMRLPANWIVCPGPDGLGELQKLPDGREALRVVEEWIVRDVDGRQAHYVGGLAEITASLMGEAIVELVTTKRT